MEKSKAPAWILVALVLPFPLDIVSFRLLEWALSQKDQKIPNVRALRRRFSKAGVGVVSAGEEP